MPSAPRTSERTYVLTVSFVHVLVHATELTFAALLLRIEADFGTDLLLLGVLANVGAFAFGFGALPAGFLVDRLGTVPVLRLALAGSALTSLFVALADGEVMLGVGLTLLGFGTGLYHPAGITLLARTRRRARNLGLHGAVGNFGIAAAPAAAAALAVLVDWRAAYFLLAALAGLTFLWSLRLDGAGPVPDPDPVTPAGGDAAPRRQGRTALLLVYGAFVVSGLIYRGSLTFIPAHIEEQVSIALFGWEAAAVAGALSTVALMGGAIGWYGGGLAAERWRRPSLLLVLSPAVVAVLLWMSFATDLGLLLAVFFFVIVSFTMQPSLVTLVAEYSPPGRLGSFAATFAGFFADRWGTDSVFSMLAAVGVVGTLLALALVGISRRRRVASTAGGEPGGG